MVSLLFSDGTRIKDKGTPEEEVAAAYRQWKEAQETARKAAAQKPQRGKVTVEDVCRVYLRTPRRTFMRLATLNSPDGLGDFNNPQPSPRAAFLPIAVHSPKSVAIRL